MQLLINAIKFDEIYYYGICKKTQLFSRTVFLQFTLFHSVFYPFRGLMKSMNWPALSVWVFIAQLVEHCSANAEAISSNPVEAPKILPFFSGYFTMA